MPGSGSNSPTTTRHLLLPNEIDDNDMNPTTHHPDSPDALAPNRQLRGERMRRNRRRRGRRRSSTNRGPSPSPLPKRSGAGVEEYAKSIVYGGMDAIVTCFSLISSVLSTTGGKLSSSDLLVLGFANLVADGISMGFGDYVSSSTEKEMADKERSVTASEWDWEAASLIPFFVDDPIDSLSTPTSNTTTTTADTRMERGIIRRFTHLGMNLDDASTVVKIFSKYKKVMVEESLMADKGLAPPDEAEKPWKNGLVTFAAFLAFGSAPLLSFMLLVPITHTESVRFAGACVLSLLSLAVLGIAKAKLAQESYCLSALMTVSNGAVAAAVAYGVGWTLRNVAGLED